MGLLDNLGGLAGALGAGNTKLALMQAVIGMLAHGNEPGGLGGAGGMGGLPGLLQRFQNAGLGDAVASWIGTGANLPVSAGEVQSALGDGPLRHLAEAAGIGEMDAAHQLSSVLPSLIDRLTPTGQVPSEGLQQDSVAGALSSLSELFSGKTP